MMPTHQIGEYERVNDAETESPVSTTDSHDETALRTLSRESTDVASPNGEVETPIQSSKNLVWMVSESVGSAANDNSKYEIHPQRQQKSRLMHVLRVWWAELLCCILVIGSLAGLIITLRVHERRSIPEWPYGLTINSVISLFTLVLKSSALVVACEGISQLKWSWFGKTRPLKDIAAYDDASRGLWGAARLIWTLKHRHLPSSLGHLLFLSP
jgi:hypothetical protein